MKAIGYLRELRAAPPALSLEGQQRAFLDACARAGLEVGATFTELAGAPGQPELRRLLRTSAGDGQRVFTVAIVAGLTVLGDSAREQWVRALQFEAAGVPLHLAGGGPL
ncbi:MAG: recombinase family protein, partial [Chloroflexi bacterium]|nr:recombinase family protein [Chloroflexota bacterium]